MIQTSLLAKAVELAVIFVWVPVVISYFELFLVYKSRKGKMLAYIGWSLYGIADTLFLTYLIDSRLERVIWSVAAWSVVGMALYKSKLKKIVFAIFGFFFAAFFFGRIIKSLFLFFHFDAIENYLTVQLILSIIIIMIIQIIKITRRNILSGEITLTNQIISIVLPICSMLVIYIVLKLDAAIIDPVFSVLSAMAAFVMLLINLFIFDFYDRLQKEAAARQRNLINERQAEICRQQCEEWQDKWMGTRSQHHDFKYHLVFLQKLNEEKNHEEMEGYLQQLLDEYAKPHEKIMSGNVIVDALLNHKMKETEKANIEWETEFESIRQLPFESTDLCTILGNAFTNAVEAVLKVPEEERTIKLKIRFTKNIFYFQICNPYVGEILTDANGRLKSGKTDKNKHGFGIHSMEETVKKYEGAMDMEIENNMFRLFIMMFGKPEENAL